MILETATGKVLQQSDFEKNENSREQIAFSPDAIFSLWAGE